MGLHLGWIPNEPGLRLRDFGQPPPAEPAPDPARVAALKSAQDARQLWSRVLIVVGLFSFALFGLLSVVARIAWGLGVAAGLAVCCWLPVLLLTVNRRRAAARLRDDTRRQAERHATELSRYERGKAEWTQSEAERVAVEPRWLRVAAHEDISRLDVFGGTVPGRQNMVTGLGWQLLEQRALIVLDLTQDRVSAGLLSAAARAGLSCRDYELPAGLRETPLLAGLSGDQVASLIVEVMHADDESATAAGRATDLMILKKVLGALGADLSMARLHAALTELLGDAPSESAGPLADAERASLSTLFGEVFRGQVTGNLVRLAAVVEPLTELGATADPPSPARLTCLSLAEGPRDVAADLTAALVVQWVTRAVGTAGEDGIRPAVILAGADEQSARHLGRLTAVCERFDIPLVRTFSRLTEESARHLDTRHTAFLRLATRPEALRAAEHIGLERRFVAGRFSRRHSVSRSRTRTTSDSVTHTAGRTEGEASTHTTGTTTGQAYSEAEVPRHDQQVHVHVEDNRERDGRAGDGRRAGDRPGEEPQQEGTERARAGAGRDRDSDSGAGNPVRDTAEKRSADPRPRDRSAGWAGTGAPRRAASGKNGRPPGRQGGKPQADIVKTKTWFTASHESQANTKSWSTTEETSHTSTTSRSRTDGVSVGDEISYELVYDHKVHPETLMALPEDQMLAPNIVESAAGPGAAVAGGGPRAATEMKMVALVIDPSVVGSAPAAQVHPGEIPAFEPPAPAVSAQVPDYQGAPRPAALPAREARRG